MSVIRIATICMGLGLIGNVSFGEEPIPKSATSPVLPPAEAFEESPAQGGSNLTTPAYPAMESDPLEYASEPSYYDNPASDPVSDPAQEGFFRRTWSSWKACCVRKQKAPHQAYNHHQSDLKPRPVVPPFCSPTWGYHEPCWRTFPDVPRCPPSAVLTGRRESTDPGSLTMPAKFPTSPRHVALQQP